MDFLISSQISHSCFITYCLCSLYLSVCNSKNQEGKHSHDKSVIGCLEGAAMATKVVDVFLPVNIPSVSPCCLPAPLRLTIRLFVCVGGKEMMSVPVLFVFVYV